MRVIFRPLERWDRRVEAIRPHSPFRAPYQDSDLRLDGQPYANTRPRHPGVTVAFKSNHGPLKYTADKFATWTENLRAIALGLEALRKVDRYGVTSRGEQYAGWKALPAAPSETVERGRDLIAQHGNVTAALKATHPDVGGNAEDFRAVQAAREAIV
jgi:hypothetical protein